MQLVERHIIKSTHNLFAEIDDLSFKSKNIYNAALYILRQNYFYGWGYLNYNALQKLMQTSVQYKALPAKVSQQVLMVLDKNWQSFWAARSEYLQQPKKFLGQPKLPKYKDKQKGRNLLVYTVQAISSVQLRHGIISLSKTNIRVKTQVPFEAIRQVRIVPKCDCYVIEVVYEQPDSTPQEAQCDGIAAIDLGVNNLATLTSNQLGFVPLLINGRPLKSMNYFYNKHRSRIQSKLRGNCLTSERIKSLTRQRNQKVDNYLHHASKLVVATLVADRIGRLVIGLNPLWKQAVALGKVNNQHFVSIPHQRFVDMLVYKCKLAGISVLLIEESYTSVASFIDGDVIPTIGKILSAPVFSGKRIHRGLYRSKGGVTLNADVNGSLNILVKAFPDAFWIGDKSCVVQPRRISPLKVKTKGKSEMVSRLA
ncbi:RNA-guided endonuclease InsQ/TnpB family protein [Microseira wollei]|uniref:Transposase n=1 Tax=Microseira wollei NIES-4236 TaxID=2530354 RepID=A0AAV3XQ42_9CYAN|nr:transposase [Microseira wollei]GET42869.1 transposase [Microseira wollei NIES-4236]